MGFLSGQYPLSLHRPAQDTFWAQLAIQLRAIQVAIYSSEIPDSWNSLYSTSTTPPQKWRDEKKWQA